MSERVLEDLMAHHPESAYSELPAYLMSLWNGDVERPGPKRGVTLQDVAQAGVRLADASGLPAVSMRAVASELGFTPMALYRYVAKKDELVAIMIDAAYGRPPQLAGRDWRERVSSWARANREVLQAHRWILQISFESPPLTPNQIIWMECGLEALSGLELTAQAALSSMLLVDVYVRGQTQLLANADTTPSEAEQQYAAHLGALIDPEQFPRIAATLTAGALSDDDGMVDEFEFGLQTLLDGIAAR